jgi:hypothetical protein
MADEAQRPAAALRRLVNGYQISQAIHVAATLRLADLLAAGPRTSDELAIETESHAPSLYRLLRALASVGVVDEGDERRFSLTAVGACLRSDAPEPVGGWAAFVGRPYHWQAWGDLLHSVRTGENAFRHVHGVDVWEFRSAHPEEGTIFDAAMTAVAASVNRAILEAYDFGRFGTLVDVGGSRGALLAAILATHTSMQGVLFDQPHVVATAAELLEQAGVVDRCRIEGGSFFDGVPEGGDAYLLKSVVHDWEDEDATAILRSCRRAIPSSGTLLLVERRLAAPNEGWDGKFSDLNMLVAAGGKERTHEEYAALLAAGGFRLESVMPTTSGFDVIEATAVSV